MEVLRDGEEVLRVTRAVSGREELSALSPMLLLLRCRKCRRYNHRQNPVVMNWSKAARHAKASSQPNQVMNAERWFGKHVLPTW